MTARQPSVSTIAGAAQRAGFQSGARVVGPAAPGAAALTPNAPKPSGVGAGLAQLRASAPLWPIENSRWLDLVDAVGAFAERWGEQAAACGWSALDLYSMHQRAPGANLAAMGAAWLIARSRDLVLRVAAEAIVVQTRAGYVLRIYRRPPDSAAVLAWIAGFR